MSDPGPADQSPREGGSTNETILSQNFKIFFIILILFLLSGCQTLTPRNAVLPCVAADVVTTVVGVKIGAMTEANPLWKATIGAGNYLPFILASVGLYLLVDWINDDRLSTGTAVVECGLAAWNLGLILR